MAIQQLGLIDSEDLPIYRNRIVVAHVEYDNGHITSDQLDEKVTKVLTNSSDGIRFILKQVSIALTQSETYKVKLSISDLHYKLPE